MTPDQFAIDLDDLETIVEGVGDEARQAWDLSALEPDEARAELWSDVAIKLEELGDLYGRLLLIYSGTSDVAAES